MNSITIKPSVNMKLLADLNLIISEIINARNYNVDIYDICVSCGHSLTWDQGYSISQDDMMWLKTTGRVHFYETLNNYMKIETVENYNFVTKLYENLLELFSLQVE
tara:strand:- start:3904 stop:4221 length:318 start_codon:yes stop_codon:yes gene_type:complete